MLKEELTKLVIILVVIAGIGTGVYFYLNKTDTGPSLVNFNSENNVGISPSSQQIINNSNNLRNNMRLITIKTNMGAIKFQTYDADAPKTVQNFIALANKGFYNNVIFHRVIKGFMIQGGDPKGNGTGGPGYAFEDELNPNTESYKAGYKKGIVAMANAGPDTNGSQFFIMLEDYSLPNNYTIFGKVVEGQNVVDAIGSVKTDSNDKPLTPVTMESVTVQEIK